MKQQTCRSFPPFFFSYLLLLSFSGAAAYKNYTVGDSLGWFDNLQKPTINYQKWVAGKNFSLGDFLMGGIGNNSKWCKRNIIYFFKLLKKCTDFLLVKSVKAIFVFNTDTNHSVIQTYNVTTYRRCDYNSAEEDDTTQWSAGQPSAEIQAVSAAVPLLKEGMAYFFSGDYDGEQCKHGQHFKINVTHGQGLPKSLESPSMDSPAPANPADDDSAPDTEIPSNFNKPVEGGDAKEAASSASSGMFMWAEGGIFNLILASLGLCLGNWVI